MLALFAASSSLLLAAGQPAEMTSMPAAVDEQVWFVATGGLWEAPGSYGTFRLVVFGGGGEHVSTRTYAQWLKYDEASHAYVVFQTLAVEPINDSFSIVRGVALEEIGAGTVTFKLSRQERETTAQTSTYLEMGAPGEFKLHASSKAAPR